MGGVTHVDRSEAQDMVTPSSGDASELVLTGPLLVASLIAAGPGPFPFSRPTRMRLNLISWLRTLMAGCAVSL